MKDLLPEVSGEFFSGELMVGVGVDLSEDVDWRRAVLDLDQLDLEVEGGSAGNDVAGSVVTVAQL